MTKCKSGICPKHSTETALVKITHDLLCAGDAVLLSILILLDLSATFDTTSNQLLMDRQTSFEVGGTVY